MSLHLHILVELRKLIVGEAQKLSDIITTGVAARDFATYKEQVGKLYAYRHALELFEEAAQTVEKRT